MTALEQERTIDPVTSPGPSPELRRTIRTNRRSTRLRIIVTTVILVPICVAWVYPFIWMVSSSLKSNLEIFHGLNPFPSVIHLNHYVRAWQEAHVGRYFFNSVFIALFTIIIAVSCTVMMGYVMGRYRFAGKKLVIAGLAVLMFLPEGYTIIPIFDLISAIGLAGSLWGIILVESAGTHIVAVLLFAGYFSQLPNELEESALLDGAGFMRTFFFVYLPLAKPVTATAIILQFMHSWNSFLVPLVFTLSRPELRTLAVGVYNFQHEESTDWAAMTAASTIALVPIIVLFLFLQRYFVESVAGAIKN